MDPMTSSSTIPVFGLLLLGLCAGYLGGLAGVGGGMIMVPALVYLFGFSQHQAQGTTLALMLPPIGTLAAWQYYRAGYVDVKFALIIIIGYVIGNYLGGKLAINVPNAVVRKAFAVLMLVTAMKMLFFSK